jgi:hypothetical protein
MNEQSKTTNGLCIHTLNFLINRLEKQLFEMQPHGVAPDGTEAIPDYSNLEYLMLHSVVGDLEYLVQLEEKAQAEYYEDMYVGGSSGPKE